MLVFVLFILLLGLDRLDLLVGDYCVVYYLCWVSIVLVVPDYFLLFRCFLVSCCFTVFGLLFGLMFIVWCVYLGLLFDGCLAWGLYFVCFVVCFGMWLFMLCDLAVVSFIVAYLHVLCVWI